MNLKIYIKFLLLAAILISCKSLCNATSLTSVGTHHNIGLSYKNDCILSIGGMMLGDNYRRLNFQTGFAYNDFLAFQMGYHYFSDNPYLVRNTIGGISFTEYYNDHFTHVAVGVFHPIQIKNSKWGSTWKNKGKWYRPRHVLFDFYMGFGKGLNIRTLELVNFGSGVTFINDLRSKTTINFNKWYAQGGLNYHGHFIGIGISGLFGVLNFRKVTILGVPEDYTIDLVNLLVEDTTYYTYGFQFKAWLCFDAITVLYHNHQNLISKQEFLNQNLFNYFGELSVQMNISQLFKKKTDKL